MTNDKQQPDPFIQEPWNNDSEKPFISIRGLTKRFGDFVAVDSVDIDIYRGELFSILGASGCGKSTLLRMMAGFEQPSAGSIFIDGAEITDVPPYKRPVNMMFQSYALFPHMTVTKNIAYGLVKEGVDKTEISRRVANTISLVQLDGFEQRKPHQLSGGQCQRVALARALIKRPKVLLLDEPLAALDKKLREQTQFELSSLQDRLGITFIVVTHDQEEAMTLSSRVAIMEKGRFAQIGTPREVYEYPKTRFAADFVGTINLFEGTIETVSDGLMRIRCDDTDSTILAFEGEGRSTGDRICIAVRPEKIFISKEKPESQHWIALRGVVHDLGYKGNLSIYRVELPSKRIVQVSAQNRRRSARRTLEWDDEVFISWDPRSAVVLDE